LNLSGILRQSPQHTQGMNSTTLADFSKV